MIDGSDFIDYAASVQQDTQLAQGTNSALATCQRRLKRVAQKTNSALTTCQRRLSNLSACAMHRAACGFERVPRGVWRLDRG